jgi:hydroxymethylpyrimidine pyrophosphatase-like HAD family hydrolase
MRFRALATDYDGTIACEGHVDDPTFDALRRARDEGLRLILVTGREAGDLTNTFTHLDLFARIVAENGAVLLNPEIDELNVLGAPAPPALIDWLTRRSIPLSVGHTIVATVQPHEQTVRDAIRALNLPWDVALNKDAVMALPADVSKATGLALALDELGVMPAETIGVGDAENDRAFLETCGLAVAVSNAVPAIQADVHIVTHGARGAGVAELLERWRRGELTRRRPPARHPGPPP